jgi:RimJ/RimL family protein N-acetyltransferase
MLRPIEHSDAAAWFEYAGNAEVMRYTSSSVRTIEDVYPILGRINSPEAGSPIHFAVCAQPEGQLIGTAGFHTISVLNRTAEITYDLHPSHWGKGIATAVCAATASWGFSAQGFVRIQATVLEANAASIGVLQRCGFQFEGKLRNFRIVRGEPRDYLLYSVIPSAPPTAGANPSIERQPTVFRRWLPLMSNVHAICCTCVGRFL